MNLKKMLEDQKKLDTAIFKNAGISEYPLENIKLALLVELGELANEDKSFKYWKKNKKTDRTKLLDEMADCLHFALSLENYYLKKYSDYDMSKYDFENAIAFKEMHKPTEKDITEAFLYACTSITNADKDTLMVIIGLGITLDISLEEMEKAYYKKHKENYKRQEEGY